MKTTLLALCFFVSLFGADTKSVVCREPFDLQGLQRLGRGEDIRGEIKKLANSDEPRCVQGALYALGLLGELDFLTSSFDQGEGELVGEAYRDKLATLSAVTIIALKFRDEQVGRDALSFMMSVATGVKKIGWRDGTESKLLDREPHDFLKIFIVTMLSRLGTEEVEKFLISAKETGSVFGKGRLVDVLDGAIKDNSNKAFENFFLGSFGHRMP